MTLAVIASFGLAVAGVSSIVEDSGSKNNKKTETSLTRNSQGSGTSTASEDSESIRENITRRAPGEVRVQLTGEAPRKVNRTLVRNQLQTGTERDKIRESLRDVHLAAVEERAKTAQETKEQAAQPAPAQKQDEQNTALAANTPKPKTLSEAAGAKIATAEPEKDRGDYRRKLLRQAIQESLNSQEPWKELIAIALVQFEIKDISASRETLNLAKKLLPAGDDGPSSRSSALVSITQALCRIGQLENALDTVSSIGNEQSRNQAISCIISEHLNRQEFSAAKTLVSSLSLVNYREGSLRNIAESEASIGKNAPAMSTLSLISGMAMRNDALKRVAVTQARTKQWDTALSTASLISTVEVAQAAQADIIRLLIDAGETQVAYIQIRNIQKEGLRDDLYGRLSRKQASLGNINNGLRTAELIASTESRENTLASVAVQQARLGDTSGAFSKVASFVNEAPQIQGVRDVTLVEANMRGSVAAFNMASMINKASTKDATLRAMAQREAGVGNLTDAVNCAQNIMAPDCRVLSLAETALSSIKNAPTRHAINVLESTTQLIPSLAEESGRKNEAIIKIANAYALINRLDESIGNLVHLPSENIRNNALEQIAYDCVDKNKLAYAQDLANRITDEQRRQNVLKNIAARHPKNVAVKDASKEVNSFSSKEERAIFLRGMAAKNE